MVAEYKVAEYMVAEYMVAEYKVAEYKVAEYKVAGHSLPCRPGARRSVCACSTCLLRHVIYVVYIYANDFISFKKNPTLSV